MVYRIKCCYCYLLFGADGSNRGGIFIANYLLVVSVGVLGTMNAWSGVCCVSAQHVFFFMYKGIQCSPFDTAVATPSPDPQPSRIRTTA